MYSSFITFASIIPGLGFLLMGKWKSALLTWMLLAPILVMIPLTSQLQAKCIFLNIVYIFIIWVWQMIRSNNIARIIDQINRKEITLLNKTNESEITSGNISTTQSKLLLIRRALETQLLPGDSIIALVLGSNSIKRWIYGNRIVCLALLEKDILIYEFGILDYPFTVKRILKINVNIFYSATNNKLLLWIVPIGTKKEKSIYFNVDIQYKQEFNEFVKIGQVKSLFNN